MTIELKRLLAATRVRDVTALLEAAAGGVMWRPVGDRENNLATINVGSDPAAGVVERVTNAIDAVLELEWINRGRPDGLRTPRAAGESWFGLPGGRLSGVDLRSPSVAELCRRVRVTLRDSEQALRPTLDVRDHGVGIRAEDFKTTILSLNESRKLRKLYLSGAFGQGGSTALSYSHYTVIVSRHAPDGSSGPAAATIVRFNPGNLETDKHGLYEYACDTSTGHPFIFDGESSGFSFGTLVRHVSMDLGRYRNVMTAPTGSLWYLAHNYLFDPVLPFVIEEQRSNTSHTQLRTVAGNHRLLTQAETTRYQREGRRTFRGGRVEITWWVLSAEGENARDRITQYVLPSRPVVITYNGQKQGELPNGIVKIDLSLPYLDRYLVVHVNCDELDSESRRQLFPTTRESLRETSLLGELRRLVVETLDGDDELRRLNSEMKQRFVQRTGSESVENIRRRLASRVSAVIMAGGSGRAPQRPEGRDPDPSAPRPEPPVIPVQEPPSFIEILGPDPRPVYAGRRFSLRFRTDADPSYFRQADAFVAVITPPTLGQYTGAASVRGGYGVAYFSVRQDAAVGESAEILLELRPKGARSLSTSIGIAVQAPPSSVGTGRGDAPTPNVNTTWIHSRDPFWIQHAWTEDSVAKVISDQGAVDIYVSAENRRLLALLRRSLRGSTALIDTISGLYLEHISFHAFLADLGAAENQSLDSPDSDVGEEVIDKELRRACETVCGMISQLYDLLAAQEQAAPAADPL